MEVESRRFYERAAARTTDVRMRGLLHDLAQAERRVYRCRHSARQVDVLVFRLASHVADDRRGEPVWHVRGGVGGG